MIDLSKKRKYETSGKRTSQRKESKHKGAEAEEHLCVQEMAKPTWLAQTEQAYRRKTLQQREWKGKIL